MKEKIKSVYYCEFCKKHGLSKSSMVEHEKRCFHNPENTVVCFDCVFLEKKQTEITEYDYNGGEHARKVNVFHCQKKDVFLIPPIVQHKGNAYDLGDELNEPMHKECELIKTDILIGF